MAELCEICETIPRMKDCKLCPECSGKVWDIKCLRCGWDCHLADYGYEVVRVGEIIQIVCPDCKAAWWKIVGEDHGVGIIRARREEALARASE